MGTYVITSFSSITILRSPSVAMVSIQSFWWITWCLYVFRSLRKWSYFIPTVIALYDSGVFSTKLLLIASKVHHFGFRVEDPSTRYGRLCFRDCARQVFVQKTPTGKNLVYIAVMLRCPENATLRTHHYVRFPHITIVICATSKQNSNANMQINTCAKDRFRLLC